MTQREQQVFDTLYARRSIRRYIQDKPVEEETVLKLLKAAMAAPSACNIQPWEFVVVSDAARISEIQSSIRKYADYFPPLVIVVCANPKFIPWEGDVGLIDCCAAIENMLIAATALELGSVWIGGFDKASIREILGVPQEVHPVGVVYFGYTNQTPAPRTQYNEAVVHWQTYDSDRVFEKKAGSIV